MDLSTVTLTQLTYLVAVDRHRSFREAASSCHVTQPALSQQVAKVEEALGVRVFDRSRQPIVPTAVGRRILEQARVVLREAERMGEVVAEAGGVLAGPFRLGVIPTLAPTLLAPLLPRFARGHPQIDLIVEEVQTDVMLARLREDTLDGGIAATPLRAAGIRERPLYREPFSAYLPPHHPLTRKRRIDQKALAQESVWVMGEGHCFRDQVLRLCEAGRPVCAEGGGSVRFESGSFETLMRLVDEGFGLTVIPELVVRQLPAAKRRASVREFAPPVPTREVSFIHARDQLRRAVADALIATLLEVLPADLVAAAKRRTGALISPLPVAADEERRT